MKRMVIAVFATAAFALQAQAQLVLDLLTSPGNATSATHTWTFNADGSAVTNAGGTTFSTTDQGLSGSLTNEGATGSFTVKIEATYEFDEATFTNKLTDIAGNKWAYNASSDTYGILSLDPFNNGIQISGSESMVMTFDMSNLTIPEGKFFYVDGFKVQNGSSGTPGGQRISYFATNAVESVRLTGNEGEPNALIGGTGAFQPVNQIVYTGDKMAIWALNNTGQKRFMGFKFRVSAPPTATDTPTNLTAIAAASRVLLDWDDDESGYPLDYYTLYRGTASGTNNYDFSTNVNVSAFFDFSVTNGPTYYYAVTSTGTNGVESAFSTEVSAVPTAVSTNEVFLAHLDASDVGSLTLVNGNEVVSWADQTGNGYTAVTDAGSTNLYPSSAFESGLQGVDFGTGVNRMNWIPSADSDAFLDQTFGDGFAVLVAFKAGVENSPDWNDIIGSTSGVDSGFGMRYSGSGVMQVYLKGADVGDRNKPGATVKPGDTVVMALNYDASTGLYDFWDSKNNSSLIGFAPPNDFSTADPIRIGYTSNTGRPMIGSIGEIQVFANVLSDSEFQSRREGLVAKWGATEPSSYELWFISYGANIGGPDADFDDDGVTNWVEYALAGDPTNALDLGESPEFLAVDGGFAMVHPRPVGDESLVYYIETRTDLAFGDWTNEVFVSMDTNVTGGVYNYITNGIDSTDPVKFFRWFIDFNQ